MDSFKCLIDSNVVIELEDARPVNALFATFVSQCSAKGVRLFVDGASYDDISRDKDAVRRAVTESKLAKFEKLRAVPISSDLELEQRFGPIRKTNDRNDARLLAALEAQAVDFVITQDAGIHRRAARAGLSEKVMTVGDAVRWLQQTFDPLQIELPFVTDKLAYELDRQAPIFEGLRADYDGFDEWLDKCAQQHRNCWVLQVGHEIAGLIIRKDETHAEARTALPGARILKICTFKVRDEFRGGKFGEHLLKQSLWFAQKNRYDLVYLTVFEKQEFLRELLSNYGFVETGRTDLGELRMEKVLLQGELPQGLPPLETHRRFYPRYVDGQSVRKFVVPIKPDYHSVLFPEIAFVAPLPLLPAELLSAKTQGWLESTPGNTIRKVYLCRAQTQQLRPGDLLFFYMSKDTGFKFSQSITSVGVIEGVSSADSYEELVRATAKRSVFSAEELGTLVAVSNGPIRVIDFLLSAHLEPPIALSELVGQKIFNGRPPQSISSLDQLEYENLRKLIHGRV